MKTGRTKTRCAQTFVLLIVFHPFVFGYGKWERSTRGFSLFQKWNGILEGPQSGGRIFEI
jgi:hypothetical protein